MPKYNVEVELTFVEDIIAVDEEAAEELALELIKVDYPTAKWPMILSVEEALPND